MAEYVAVTAQTVAVGDNVLFYGDADDSCKMIIHREGSGLFTLKGMAANHCKAKYRVFFGGNIEIPATGAPGEISLAIAVNGEALEYTRMRVVPGAVSRFFNIARETYIDVPCGCCVSIAIENVSGQAVDVIDANIIIEKVA